MYILILPVAYADTFRNRNNGCDREMSATSACQCGVVQMQHPVRKLRGWRMTTIKLCGAAFGIAVLVSCAWGMTRADRGIVADTFSVVDDLKVTLTGPAWAHVHYSSICD